MHRARYGRGASILCVRKSPSQNLHIFTNPGALGTLKFWVFNGSFIMQTRLLKSLGIGEELYLQPFLSSEGGGRQKVPILLLCWSFWRPTLRATSYQTSHQQKVLLSLLRFKGFRAMSQESVQRPNIFYYIAT